MMAPRFIVRLHKFTPKIIRDFAVVGHVERGEVGVFANLERAGPVMNAERVGGIDGGCGDGFRGSHAELIAGARDRITDMLSVGLVPGLKSVAMPMIAPASMSWRAGP